VNLRRRLLAALLALLAAVSLVIGLVSVLALDRFLVGRLDDQLTLAARRSRNAVGRLEQSGGRPPATSPTPPGTPATPPAQSTPRRPGAAGPLFLLAPGQAEGTLGARLEHGRLLEGAVLGSDGTPVMLSAAQAAPLTRLPVDARPHTVALSGGLGDYRAVAFSGRSGDVVVTGLPLAGVRATVLRLAAVVSAVAGGGLILAAAAAWMIIGVALRPLHRIAATATRVTQLPLSRGEVALGVRVPAGDADAGSEVGQLGRSLNRMLDHVAAALAARQASEERVRRFVADASHELRTPLAAIRGYAELTRRHRAALPADVGRALERVESESLRMSSLVDDLLMLARLDEELPAQREPVDLSRLLVDLLADAHAAGPGHRWSLELPAEPVLIQADPGQLHQVVANLLTNARTHTPPGTSVHVRLRTDAPNADAPNADAPNADAPNADAPNADAPNADAPNADAPDADAPDAGVELTVTDDGPGIAPGLLPEVFARFARGDGSRSRTAGGIPGSTGGTGGTGLGLAIVAAVVGAHGGTVLATSGTGRTTFTVRLPTA
jgi:two-component system OmpR family sensor kinase